MSSNSYGDSTAQFNDEESRSSMMQVAIQPPPLFKLDDEKLTALLELHRKNTRDITLIGHCLFLKTMAEIAEHSEAQLKGTPYETYEYKPHMARNMPRTIDRSDEQRQKSNEASRRSRFNRRRREFIQQQMNTLVEARYQLLDRWYCWNLMHIQALRLRVQNQVRGNQIIDNYIKETLEDKEFFQRELEMLANETRNLKRRRSESQNGHKVGVKKLKLSED